SSCDRRDGGARGPRGFALALSACVSARLTVATATGGDGRSDFAPISERSEEDHIFDSAIQTEEPPASAGGSARDAWGCARKPILSVGKGDQRFEFVTARFAFPEMPNAVPVEVLGPFRQENRLPALGTVVQQPRLNVFSGALGSELHDASSVMLTPPKSPC